MSLTIQRDTARAALTDCVSDFNYLAGTTADEGLKTWLLDRSKSMQATIDIMDADSTPADTTTDPDPYTKADSVDCLEQQANAWRHVAEALHSAFPQWHKLKDTGRESAVEAIRLLALRSSPSRESAQPRLTVKILSFPESNGKRNWTALLMRVDKFDGLIGNAGGITIARGELWNRVAYEAERTRFLIGERDTEPHIFDYGDDIHTPEEWAGEVRGGKGGAA